MIKLKKETKQKNNLPLPIFLIISQRKTTSSHKGAIRQSQAKKRKGE
jgi:hypothetical protein